MSWADFLCNLKKENGFFHFQCQEQLLGQAGAVTTSSTVKGRGLGLLLPLSGGSCLLCARPALLCRTRTRLCMDFCFLTNK